MSNISDHTDDAVAIAPHLHEIIFENDKIRVLKVTVKPGDKADMHWHPENINYILKSGKLRFIKPDGSTVDIELTEGQVTSSPESSHAVENIGDTEVQTVQVELKS
jgi:oxalate decarboxylase/phosphoglucose isomerase-like protein (cupin superfamily)